MFKDIHHGVINTRKKEEEEAKYSSKGAWLNILKHTKQ